MQMTFFKYKICYGDTLHSISSRLAMTEEELKLFHNKHCEKINTLWFENLNHIEFLLIPHDYKTEEQKEQEKKDSLPSLQLSNVFFAEEYKVREIFEGLDEAPLAIDYTVNLERREHPNDHVVTFNRKDFVTNGEIPDDKISALSIACMESILPVDFLLHDSGLIDRFSNHDAIKANFNEKRHDLEDYFLGETNKNYIDLFQENCRNEKLFFQQFCSTLLFQTLFPTMEWFQKKIPWTESFYFFQNSFQTACHMEAEYIDKDKDCMLTVLKGKTIESGSLQELKRGIRWNEKLKKNISGEILLQYTTDKQSKHLIQAEATLMLWNQGVIYQKHHLTLTQMK